MFALNAGAAEVDVLHLMAAIEAQAVETAPAQPPIDQLRPIPKQELPFSARVTGALSTFGEDVFSIFSIAVNDVCAALLAIK